MSDDDLIQELATDDDLVTLQVGGGADNSEGGGRERAKHEHMDLPGRRRKRKRSKKRSKNPIATGVRISSARYTGDKVEVVDASVRVCKDARLSLIIYSTQGQLVQKYRTSSETHRNIPCHIGGEQGGQSILGRLIIAGLFGLQYIVFNLLKFLGPM